MADEMQEIEARLAAYVDGTLPADQRAEIEAYLKANANHGRLISELKSIKSAVASLPKETAPAEVLDGLQAHLERHQLLEGVEESVSTSRIQRWPQFGALAAVLMLAAGLGVLVYAVLPRQKGPPPELAMLPDVLSTQPTGSDEVPAGGASLNDLGVAAKRSEIGRDDQVSGAAARSAAPGQQYQNQVYSNGVAVESQVPNVSLPAIADMTKADSPKLAMPASPAPQSTLRGPTRVLTVTTDDPILTANLISGYFSQANLSFQRVASVESVLPNRSREVAFSLADATRSKPVPTTLSETPTLGEAAELETARPSAAPATQPSEVVVLRQLSTQQLADAETAVRAQRFSRQRTDADWVGEVSETKTESATQPSTLPARMLAVTANEPPATSQPSLNQAAGSGLVMGGAAAPPAGSQPAADSAGVSNLVIVVVAGEVNVANTTRPATAPSPVAEPAAAPATLPTTQP